MIKGTAAGAAIAFTGTEIHAAAAQKKPRVKLASTNYTEQFILIEMLGFLLKDHGYEISTEHNLGGFLVTHEGRNNGDIDVQVEYTGSGLTVLGMEVSDIREDSDTPDEVVDKVYDVVKASYEEQWNAIWLDPLGINNTYALAMRRAQAEELGIEKISDLADHDSDLVLGASHAFLAREDGLPGIEKLYGLTFKGSQGMESGLMYHALESAKVDVISAFATDGRIPAMDFKLLDDDMGFFPPYHGCPLVRGELLEQAPETRDILNSLAGTLDNETMANLNYRVDDGGEDFTAVAREFLLELNLIKG